MRILGVTLILGTLSLVAFWLCPASLTWLHAVLQERAYSPGDFFTDGPFAPGVLLIIATCTIFFVLLRRLVEHAPPRLERLGEIAGDEGGLLVFEFALVFPFILALIFILFQWAELLMADALVHYAAFCTARTSSTFATEPTGAARYVLPNVGEKGRKMAQSAYIALLPAMALEGVGESRRVTPKVTPDHQLPELVQRRDQSQVAPAPIRAPPKLLVEKWRRTRWKRMSSTI